MNHTMTNQQILEKAIAQAVQNGFDLWHEASWTNWEVDKHTNDLIVHCEAGGGNHHSYGKEEVIFDHDFAKAFWGEEVLDEKPDGNMRVDEWGWQHHLQEQVISDDPIRYLERGLK